MQSQFWLDVWDNNDIGFDQKEVNPLLSSHVKSLDLSQGDSIFVPLCGKSIDMIWLLKQGYRVVGVELSEDAIVQFFDALNIKPVIGKVDSLIRYSAENIDIWVGDFFNLTQDTLGSIDAIYDRASLVALPHDMRVRYTQHLLSVTGAASQLLITFEYDQTQQDGPPFSISKNEVSQHYAQQYQATLLESIDVAGGLKGGCVANEQIWLLD